MPQIRLKNNVRFDPTKVICFKKQQNCWMIKLEEGDMIDCALDELPWLAKICGAMVEVADGLVINLFKISSVVPNDLGYVVQVEGEEPLQLTKEKGETLLSYCQELDLAEEIAILEAENIDSSFKKL